MDYRLLAGGKGTHGEGACLSQEGCVLSASGNADT